MTAPVPPKEPQGADRRESERIPCELDVRFAPPDQIARSIKAYSLNLSLGGMCLRIQRHLEVREALTLAFEVEGEAFTLAGAVAWIRDGAIGVRFEEVSEQNRARLLKMLALLQK